MGEITARDTTSNLLRLLCRGRHEEELEDFDPEAYGTTPYGYYKVMKTPRQYQLHVGKCARLITDMIINGATDEELLRAMMYTKVVVHAYRRMLDYQLAYRDFGIKELERKYRDIFRKEEEKE